MKIKKRASIAITLIVLIFAFYGNYSTVFADGKTYYLGGYVAGFSIRTRGATVVGISEVITDKGVVSPSENAGIKIGDVILSLNGKEVNAGADIDKILSSHKNGYIVTEILRDKALKIIDVFPEKDLTGKFRLGLFLRDDLTGLGTITYVTENGCFASLGHPVSDENGKALNVIGGSVYAAEIIGTNKAKRGTAGELKGIFIGKPKGEITANRETGMYGKFFNFKPDEKNKIETGRAHIGKAKIYSTVTGQNPEYYDIEIVKADGRKNVGKNIVIKITDKKLLSLTGGILQGMSGSPIVQDGRLVGAVTHVFINDATRGYGINVDNMTERQASVINESKAS